MDLFLNVSYELLEVQLWCVGIMDLGGVLFIIRSASWINSLFIIRFWKLQLPLSIFQTHLLSLLLRHTGELFGIGSHILMWASCFSSIFGTFFRLGCAYSSIVRFTDSLLPLSLHSTFYWRYCIFMWDQSYSVHSLPCLDHFLCSSR